MASDLDSLTAELLEVRSRLASLTGKARKTKKARRLKQKACELQAALQANEEAGETSSDRCPARGNYLPGSATGCHIAALEADWIVDCSPYDPAEFGSPASEEIPDISIDPETMLLTVINRSSSNRSFFITLMPPVTPIFDGGGEMLENGEVRDEEGTVFQACATLVLVLRPLSIMDVCYVSALPQNDGQFFSDIKDLSSGTLLSQPSGVCASQSPRLCGFPLGGNAPSLCSQGFGGTFTHFFPGTLHAIDFECAVGTPVVAVGDGLVLDVRDDHRVGGIHAKNLFLWNSLTLRLDSGIVVEYVHIATGSCAGRCKVGQRVVEGQEVCLAGDVGFCPRPHLHFQVHDSDSADAPTVPFVFRACASDGTAASAKPFVPIAGQWYDKTGQRDPPGPSRKL